MQRGAMVWIYPEKTHEPFGATRWLASWYVLRPGVDPDSEEDWDPGFDTIEKHIVCKTADAARRAARKVVASGATLFGCAEVQEQRVDWFVAEDRVAEWADVGRAEEVSR